MLINERNGNQCQIVNVNKLPCKWRTLGMGILPIALFIPSDATDEGPDLCCRRKDSVAEKVPRVFQIMCCTFGFVYKLGLERAFFGPSIWNHLEENAFAFGQFWLCSCPATWSSSAWRSGLANAARVVKPTAAGRVASLWHFSSE